MNLITFPRFGAIAASAALLLTGFAPSAFAATSTPKHARDYFLQGVADATSTTFATTSYADLTGATVTVLPVRDGATTDAASGVQTNYLRVSYSLVMAKATATTGTCGVYVNGAVLAKTERSVGFLASLPASNVSGVFLIPNTTSGSQTVKIQCKSGDTNVLTTSAGHLVVEEVD